MTNILRTSGDFPQFHATVHQREPLQMILPCGEESTVLLMFYNERTSSGARYHDTDNPEDFNHWLSGHLNAQWVRTVIFKPLGEDSVNGIGYLIQWDCPQRMTQAHILLGSQLIEEFVLLEIRAAN